MAEKHGRELVDMIKESGGELIRHDQLPSQEREVDGHTIQAMYFNYSGGAIAVVLVRWEASHKKHGPTTNYNLAVVNLGNAEINPNAIDDLVRQNVEGIPHLPVLRKAEYIITEGDTAKRAYKRLETKPPITADDFATQLGKYMPNTYNHPNAASLFSPQLRLRLGRR